MLNKKLGRAIIALMLGFSCLACGKNDPPNASRKDTYTQSDTEKKKFSSDKWEEFQQGFKKKNTIAESIRNGRVKVQMDSIEKEYNIKRGPLSSRIDPKKWEEFQIAFTTRAKMYINNITSAFN
jgi:hypothetical protein